MLFLWSFQSWRIEIFFVYHHDCFCPLFLVLLLPFRRDSCVCSLVSPDDSFGAIDVYLDKKRISWMQRSWKRFSRRTKISFGRKRDTIFFFYRSGSELVSNESSFTPLPKRHVRSSRLEIRNEAPSTTNRSMRFDVVPVRSKRNLFLARTYRAFTWTCLSDPRFARVVARSWDRSKRKFDVPSHVLSLAPCVGKGKENGIERSHRMTSSNVGLFDDDGVARRSASKKTRRDGCVDTCCIQRTRIETFHGT